MDIEEYEFYDDDIELDAENSDLNTIHISAYYQSSESYEDWVTFCLIKADVIALAKHFKLTLEDIKE